MVIRLPFRVIFALAAAAAIHIQRAAVDPKVPTGQVGSEDSRHPGGTGGPETQRHRRFSNFPAHFDRLLSCETIAILDGAVSQSNTSKRKRERRGP